MTQHTHHYSGQALVHAHPGGDREHGYYGHHEDGVHVTCDHGAASPGVRLHYHDATGAEDTPCACPVPGAYAPQHPRPVMANRFHSSDDMDGLRELAGVTEPCAVVVRPDGSLDVYGAIGVVDQRKEADHG